MIRSLLFAWLPFALSEVAGPIDLSHFFDNDTVYWPRMKQFDFTKVVVQTGKRDDIYYTYNEFEAAEHGGTHLDAPCHFHRDTWKIGDIPVERFIGKAVYVNLRAKALENRDYKVGAVDFEHWEEQHGPMPENAIVLLDFGWTDKYHNHSEYFGTSDISNFTTYHFPGLSEEGAQWLVDTGKVYGVGTDTASIDCGQSMMFKGHRTLAKNNLFALEHIAYPKEGLDPSGYKILALPMKIREGTGAPCRVLAVQ